MNELLCTHFSGPIIYLQVELWATGGSGHKRAVLALSGAPMEIGLPVSQHVFKSQLTLVPTNSSLLSNSWKYGKPMLPGCPLQESKGPCTNVMSRSHSSFVDSSCHQSLTHTPSPHASHQFPPGLKTGRDKWGPCFHITPSLAEASLEWDCGDSGAFRPCQVPAVRGRHSQYLTLSYEFTLIC